MMITTSDIGNVLYRHCARLSVKDICRGWNFPKGELSGERVSITVKTVSSGKPWSKAYAEVNVCVPDMEDGEADLIRLAELEREYSESFGTNTSVADGIRYRFRRESVSLLDDSGLRCHYVNIRVLFEFLNTIEQWELN